MLRTACGAETTHTECMLKECPRTCTLTGNFYPELHRPVCLRVVRPGVPHTLACEPGQGLTGAAVAGVSAKPDLGSGLPDRGAKTCKMTSLDHHSRSQTVDEANACKLLCHHTHPTHTHTGLPTTRHPIVPYHTRVGTAGTHIGAGAEFGVQPASPHSCAFTWPRGIASG